MPAENKWRLSGDYFENCNCDVVCPCLFSTAPPLTARPTQGECNVPLSSISTRAIITASRWTA